VEFGLKELPLFNMPTVTHLHCCTPNTKFPLRSPGGCLEINISAAAAAHISNHLQYPPEYPADSRRIFMRTTTQEC